jgi:hypothetical protein
LKLAVAGHDADLEAVITALRREKYSDQAIAALEHLEDVVTG